jgi:hypothetical protein
VSEFGDLVDQVIGFASSNLNLVFSLEKLRQLL